MRTIPTAVLACAALLSAGTTRAQEPRVTYQLVEPSGFEDFEIGREGLDHTAKVFDEQFREHFVPAAERILPQGQRLVLTIHDVDMAGDIQPWRNRLHEPVRYVEFGFPPKIDLEYQLLDPAGGVLAEGREMLTDKSFDMRPATAHRDEQFMFEIDLLELWLKKLVSSRAQ